MAAAIIQSATKSGNKAHGNSSHLIRSWRETWQQLLSESGTRTGSSYCLIRNWRQEQDSWQQAIIQSETRNGNKTHGSSWSSNRNLEVRTRHMESVIIKFETRGRNKGHSNRQSSNQELEAGTRHMVEDNHPIRSWKWEQGTWQRAARHRPNIQHMKQVVTGPIIIEMHLLCHIIYILIGV